MRRAKIGDVIEIKTRKGLAYALYTHRHRDPPRYGSLLRVLEGEYDRRPADIKDVLRRGVRFSTFFPLGAAVNRGIVEVVGNVGVPEELKVFPTFRVPGLTDRETKKVVVWGMWDGEKRWRVGTLTPEQRKLPILGTWNDTMLIHRIEQGWRPEDSIW